MAIAPAFTELYIRHGAAARRLATTYAQAGEPDDLVNEAFERVLRALERGSGPDYAFRAYLFVTVRRLSGDIIARRHDEPMAELPEPVRAGLQRAVLLAVLRPSIPSRCITMLRCRCLWFSIEARFHPAEPAIGDDAINEFYVLNPDRAQE